jgi:hypothetical protein
VIWRFDPEGSALTLFTTLRQSKKFLLFDVPNRPLCAIVAPSVFTRCFRVELFAAWIGDYRFTERSYQITLEQGDLTSNTS